MNTWKENIYLPILQIYSTSPYTSCFLKPKATSILEHRLHKVLEKNYNMQLNWHTCFELPCFHS